MIKIIRTVIILTVVLVFSDMSALFASAESMDEATADMQESIVSELDRVTDDEARDVLGDLELDVSRGDSVSGFSIPKILRGLFSRFYSQLSAPAGMLGKLIAAVLLCALARGMSQPHSEMNEVYNTVCVLVSVLAVYDCINSSIAGIVSAMDRLSSFMLSYIPIYASVTAASGNYTSAAAFYGSNLFLCECTAFLARKLLLPLLSVLTAFSIAAALNKDIKLGSAVSSVKKVMRWIIGIMMTVFCGLLTVQSAVGAAADSVRTRTVRFAASSFIPIIGSAVSESYSAIKGSLHVIRTGSGAIGIVLIAATVLYPLIAVLAVRAVLAVGQLVCDVFGQEDMSAMIRSMNDILAIGMSVLICISMMFIISTAIIMLTVQSVGV